MSNEIIIKKSSTGLEIALLSDKKLTEFHKETSDASFQVGDFYLGKVRKISPSLNAAFVSVGGEKDGFLTYFDLGPNVRSLQKFVRMVREGNPGAGDLDQFQLEEQTVKTGKIGHVLKSGETVLVQVMKEPIANKGPKITCDISLPGRYFILVPFSRQVSISKKIGNAKEKARLKDLAYNIKPKNFGVIVRTVSEGVAIEELDKDLRDLLKKWDELVLGLKKANIGERVIGEGNRIDGLLRDVLNDSYSQIIVEDQELHTSLKKTLDRYKLDATKILKLYSGKQPLFDQYGITKQIKASFGKNVPFSGGAYLVIEHTEALHVIDVNSGNTSFDPSNREENVYKVNVEAVDEIARQIRLRDMGGIIVIDFIDMRDPKKKAALHQALKDAMEKDRAKHNILPMSKFGLVQITRERVRPALEISTSELCSNCMGTGVVDSNVQLLDKIENEVTYLWENMNQSGLTLRANKLITNYYKAGFPSIRMKWWIKHRQWLKLETDPSLPITGYLFINSDKQVINNNP